uniref:Uncharacterized protein n=1 Tax=Ixodes ricinus TaxID=34613 RepID=A0A6B0V1P5_IXORI
MILKARQSSVILIMTAAARASKRCTPSACAAVTRSLTSSAAERHPGPFGGSAGEPFLPLALFLQVLAVVAEPLFVQGGQAACRCRQLLTFELLREALVHVLEHRSPTRQFARIARAWLWQLHTLPTLDILRGSSRRAVQTDWVRRICAHDPEGALFVEAHVPRRRAVLHPLQHPKAVCLPPQQKDVARPVD